ncbi:hypothetical protein ACFE04_003622 [Oxalis oulophora]
MAFRGKEMMNKLMKKIGGEKNLAAGVKEKLKRCIPDRNVIMGRAERGLFVGRHIRFDREGVGSQMCKKSAYSVTTPYQKMDTEMGLFWKVKIEKLYQELGQMEVVFFSPEDETKFEQGFKDLKIAERDAHRDARRRIYGWSGPKQIEEGKDDDEEADVHEQVAVNS